MHLNCPACAAEFEAAPLESHKDPIAGGRYEMFSCASCGVVFAEPRQSVGADWYEKAAPIRALEKRPSPSHDWRFRCFLAENLQPGRLLDVGCGEGGFLALAKGRGFSVVGFDYDRRMIELARQRGIVEAESAEFSDWSLRRKAGEFSYITLFDVLEHHPEPARFLSELKRLLKPGGVIAITLPNTLRPLPWGREEHDYPPHHFTRWSSESMRTFLESHGFRVVHQISSHLKISYLYNQFFFCVVMPKLLPAIKRALFGTSGSRTISELYQDAAAGGAKNSSGSGIARRLLSQKLRRQQLVNAFKALCSPIVFPAAVGMTFYYLLTKHDCGDWLYTLARLE
jgi:2-polyprenyl-3-methyl-5-hydroxy-6-metoxy-1,4-benzoquinol methylase